MTTVLDRNIAEILPTQKDFEARLKKGPIKIYLGIDPSSAQIHIGNAVALWKLRELQDQGHKVILLIGDFTGMIGDPTDRSAPRIKLTHEQVLENAKDYQKQSSKILEFEGDNPAELKFNSHWLAKLNFEDLIELASHLTVQQMLERDFFQNRLKEQKPIHLHEFFYPLMQGYDSVAMEVDAEIGGTDQTFNMLVGRTLMKALKDKEKFVISVPLLEGLDGRKMSKSFGNTIAVTDAPSEMFGKTMSLNDELIERYFSLTTPLSKEEIEKIKKDHPMEQKKRLGWALVKLYHNEAEANKAKEYFESTFQKGVTPTDIPSYSPKGEETVVDVLVNSGVVSSKSDARRLIDQGGVESDGQRIKDTTQILNSGTLKIGKHRFLKIN